MVRNWGGEGTEEGGNYHEGGAQDQSEIKKLDDGLSYILNAGEHGCEGGGA